MTSTIYLMLLATGVVFLFACLCFYRGGYCRGRRDQMVGKEYPGWMRVVDRKWIEK